jgi:WD40 repeat protein
LPGRYTYSAFISHSRTDARLARAVQRRIESYRVPKGIPSASHSPVLRSKRRLLRVFRDDDELPASADLGATLRQALDQSAFLVVLASPAAAASRWVNTEADHFLRNERARDILVVTRPNEASVPRYPSQELPPALQNRSTEALYVELGDRRSARRRTYTRLVAGLLGVDFDTLWRRERRHRRRQIVTWVIATLVLVAIAGSTFRLMRSDAAISQRRAMSGRLLAEATGLKDEQPNASRQLIAAAYDEARAPETTGAMLAAWDLPGSFTTSDKSFVYETRVAFFPDSRTVATSNDEIRDLRSDQVISRLRSPPGRNGRSDALALSADGRTLAIGDGWNSDGGTSGRGAVELWDVTNPKQPVFRTRLPEFSLGITAVAISASGSEVVAASADGELRLWNLSSSLDGRSAIGLLPPGQGVDHAVGQLQLSPDGHLLVAAIAGTPGIQIFNLSKAALSPAFAVLPGTSTARVPSVIFSPDGHTLLTTGDSGAVINFWSFDSAGSLHKRSALNSPGPVDDLALSPDGQTLWANGSESGALWRWNVSRSRPIQLPSLPTSGLPAQAGVMTLSPDGTTLVLGTTRVVRVWSLDNPHVALAPEWGLTLVSQYSSDGRTLVTRASTDIEVLHRRGRDNEPLQVWDVSDRAVPRLVASVDDDKAGGGQVVAISNDRSLLAVDDGLTLCLWDLTDAKTPQLRTRLAFPGGVESPAISASGDIVAVATEQDPAAEATRWGVTFWQTAKGSAPQELGRAATSKLPNRMQFLRDDHFLVADEALEGLRVWDLSQHRVPQLVNTIQTTGTGSYVMSSDERFVALSGQEEVQLWDMSAPARPKKLGSLPAGDDGDPRPVFSARADLLLVNGSALWDVRDPRKPQLVFRVPTRSQSGPNGWFSADSANLQVVYAAETGEQLLTSWAIYPDVLRNSLCHSVGDRLSESDWVRYAGRRREAPCP